MQQLDFAGLAASLAVRIRSSSAAVIMERGALIKAMTALDDIEQSWRATLARASRQHDDGLLYATLEEMLEIDVLSRAWAAFVAASVDAGKNPLRNQHAAALLTRMLLQERRRLLTVVIQSALDFESLQQLDRLRRACERWSDILLSVFPSTSSAQALRFVRENTCEFADLWPAPEVCAARKADPVIITALRSSLPPIQIADSPRRDAFGHLADSILAALRYDGRKLVVPIAPGV